MSISNYLNDYVLEPAEESEVLGAVAMIAILLAGIGVIIHDIKENKRGVVRINENKINTEELKKRKEEYLKSHSLENVVSSMISDIKKMITEVKKNPEIRKKLYRL